MIDREKVIKGVECHRKKIQTTNAVSCLECPYSEPKPVREWCMSGLIDDIYALLKEQEPVKPTRSEGTTWWFKCGKCGMSLDPRDKFCRECGRTIEWN